MNGTTSPADLVAIFNRLKDLERLIDMHHEMIRELEDEVLRRTVEIDFPSYLRRHRKWSEKTFGPGERNKGVVAHIRKELKEIEESDYADPMEWVDVAILAIDGLWRNTPELSDEERAMLFQRKQNINIARKWPDWRTMGKDKPIEHVKAARELVDA